MKKNILKKTYNLILVCIMLSLVLVGIMGIVYNFNGNLDKIISGYKISDILVPYNEYELIPSAKIVETEAYIDKDGNVIRKVPSKTELGNIDLPKKEEFDEKGNKKKETEKTKTEPVDKEVQEKGYKIEKRQFPENDEKVMNKLGMKKSAEIIVRQLRSEGFENARVSEDEKTGKIVVKVSDELEKGGIFSSSSKKKESSSKEKEAVKSILQTRGTLTVQDPDTGKEYITEENIKAVNILRTENDGAFLEIRLDEKGKKILSEISRKYNIEEKQKEGSNEKTKINHNILIKISEMEVLRAPFAEPNDTGILQLKMLNSEKLKESENKKTIEEALGEVRRLKTALELRKNTYKIYITKHYRKCMTLKVIAIVILVIAILMALSYIYFRGIKGLYYTLVLISYIMVVTLFIRFTDIVITIPGIIGIIILYILEYLVLLKTVRNKENEKEFNPMYNLVELLSKTYIIVILSVILSFSTNILLSSLGMTLFVRNNIIIYT